MKIKEIKPYKDGLIQPVKRVANSEKNVISESEKNDTDVCTTPVAYSINYNNIQKHFLDEQSKENDFERKIKFDIYKKNSDLTKYGAMEQIKLARKLVNFKVVCLDDGYIYKILLNSEGEVAGGNKVCEAKYMKLTKYKNTSRKIGVYVITFEISGEQKSLTVLDCKWNSKCLVKKLEMAGVAISASREHRGEIVSQFFALLVRNCETIEVPFTTGWCKKDDGWHFFDYNELTLRRLIENA